MSQSRRTRHLTYLAPALLALSGCATFSPPDERVLYADWTDKRIIPGTDWRAGNLQLPGGERVRLASLSDGKDAIELTCAAPEWRVSRHEATHTLFPLTEAERMEEEDHRRSAAARIARERCFREALRVCRQHTWDGRATFALLGDFEFFGSIDGSTARYGRKIFVRCLTHQAYKEWAASMPPSEVHPHAAQALEKLLRSE